MTNYTQAAEYLGKKTDRPLSGRSTRIVRRSEDAIAIRYHVTDVVTYYADGRIVVNSGGYHTSNQGWRAAVHRGLGSSESWTFPTEAEARAAWHNDVDNGRAESRGDMIGVPA